MKTRFYRIFKFSRIFKPSLLNFVLRRIDRVKSLWATKSVSLIVLKIQTRFMVVFFFLGLSRNHQAYQFSIFPSRASGRVLSDRSAIGTRHGLPGFLTGPVMCTDRLALFSFDQVLRLFYSPRLIQELSD